MIGIPIGLLTANATEWVMHKYVLHGLGKNKESFWSFHWHDHHRKVRKHDHYDPDYQQSVIGWHGQGKEALALVAAGVLQLPLVPFAPFFCATMYYAAWNYYRKHKRSHVDPEWAREHLPWHVDHHLGPDQDANWCVTRPWFDIIMGTRKPYVGTALEAKHHERKKQAEERKRRRQAARRPARQPARAPA